MAPRIARTFSILGADGAGKTALVEAFLRAADAKRASPEGSTSRLDADPEEKKRNFTLSIHPETFEEGGRVFNALDTPGFAAFINEAEWALQVSDGAVLVVSAVDGAHNRAERIYDVLADSGRPAIAVLGRIDHDQADFRRAIADVESSLKVKAIPVQLPIGSGAGGGLKGIVDLLSMKAHLYDRTFGKFAVAEIPADMKAEVEAARTALVEAAAESNDELLGKYLEGTALSAEEIEGGLAAGAAQQRVLPVAVVAAKPGVGVRELLDLLARLLPAPEARLVKGVDLHGTEVERRADAAAPFCAQVFRTTIDHFAGRVDYLRVLAGTLKPEATVMNPRTRSEERVSRLFRTDGAQTVEVPSAGPGDVVVLMKLKDARTGDTLCDKDAPILLPDFRQPNRPVAYAIQAKGGADDKAAAAIHKLIEEDPSLDLQRNPDTGEFLLSAVGQAHIEVTVERLKRKHSVEIQLAVAHAGLPRDHHGPLQGAGQVQAPDRWPRPVRRLHRRALPAGPRERLRVRGRHRGRRHPAPVHPLGREGHPRRAALRTAGRLPGGRLPGQARLRQLPRRRQLRHGIPDRRVDGLQEGHGGRAPHPPRAGHEARRARPRGVRGRGHG